jgi:predicted secreted protein
MLRPLAFGSWLAAMIIASYPAQAQDRKKNPENERVCKISEETGSRLIKHKVCMTRKEWKTEQDEQARELRDNQSGGVKTTTDEPRRPG